MKSSSLLKTIGKFSDYFFGFGDKDDYYNEFNKNQLLFGEEYTQSFEKATVRLDKNAKIFVRTTITLLELSYLGLCLHKNETPNFLPFIGAEIFRMISLLSDYKNKKDILKRKDLILESMVRVCPCYERPITLNTDGD